MKKISLGGLVEIKIRNRKVMGIVSEVEELQEKNGCKIFCSLLSKIERVLIDNFLSEEIFKSISESATLLGVKESEILENYLPDFIFENIDILNKKDNGKMQREYTEEIYIGDFESRIQKYLEKIKINEKENKSSIIFFPTINDLEIIKNI